MKGLLREPLLHFVLLGGSIFAVFAVARSGNRPPEVDGRCIVISRGHVDQMITGFTRTWHRPPTQTELAGLIEDQVREEVLSREAIALGLDKDDTIIRRRLRQKMEFLIDDDSLRGAPGDETLRAHYQAHAEKYRDEARLSFEHVFLDAGKRDEAGKILASLTAGGAAEAAGDPFLLPLEFNLAARLEIMNMFGEPFAKRLDGIAPGAWSGPLESSYGLHLVRVRERREARIPPFDEVKDAVRRDWMQLKRRETTDELYKKLRERYRVVLDVPELKP